MTRGHGTKGDEPGDGGPTTAVDRAHGTLAEARLAFVRAYLARVGRELGWNKTAMARRLGLNRSSLHRILKRCGVKEDNADEH